MRLFSKNTFKKGRKMYTLQNTMFQIPTIIILWPIAYRLLKRPFGFSKGFLLYISFCVSDSAAIAVWQDYKNTELIDVLLPYMIFFLLVPVALLVKKTTELFLADLDSKTQRIENAKSTVCGKVSANSTMPEGGDFCNTLNDQSQKT